MIELHVIFRGRVQGVGFRWTIVDHAEKFQLTGTTKNLSDGTVEVYAQGKKESLETFLKIIKNEPGLARIDSVTSEYKKPNKFYRDFRIVD
jgi:acylphosphatase